jgi:hypothetical protein
VRPVVVRDVITEPKRAWFATWRVIRKSSTFLTWRRDRWGPRALGSTSVGVHFFSVGRPGLDPGTLGLKETLRRLSCVGLVAHVVCFKGIVLF